MTERQKRFCAYYAASGNAADAARMAGYSPKTARSQGQRLLTKVDILKYIRRLQDELAAPRVASVVQTRPKNFGSRANSGKHKRIPSAHSCLKCTKPMNRSRSSTVNFGFRSLTAWWLGTTEYYFSGSETGWRLRNKRIETALGSGANLQPGAVSV